MTERLFHLTTASDWAAAQRDGRLEPASLADHGFVHLSTRAQVHGTRARFYADVTDLILLEVDPAALGDAAVVFEGPIDPVTGQPERRDDGEFPHLYGPLFVSAVVRAHPFSTSDPDPFANGA